MSQRKDTVSLENYKTQLIAKGYNVDVMIGYGNPRRTNTQDGHRIRRRPTGNGCTRSQVLQGSYFWNDCGYSTAPGESTGVDCKAESSSK